MMSGAQDGRTLAICDGRIVWVCVQVSAPNARIRVGRASLRRMRRAEVLVRRWPNPALPWQWFRVMDEVVALVVGACGHVYEADEYDMVCTAYWALVVCIAL